MWPGAQLGRAMLGAVGTWLGSACGASPGWGIYRAWLARDGGAERPAAHCIPAG